MAGQISGHEGRYFARRVKELRRYLDNKVKFRNGPDYRRAVRLLPSAVADAARDRAGGTEGREALAIAGSLPDGPDRLSRFS